jgi:hypothetical protein
MKHKGPITLDEASLSRAYQHVVDKKEPSWGIVTAHRTTFSKKENEARNKQLEKDVRGMGYGFFKMEGHWRECQDTNVSYQDCPPEKLKDATETPLFIPGIKEDQIKKLCKKYDQDSVIYGDTKEDQAKLIFRNGNEDKIGKFHPNKIAQAYSKIKGDRTFTFEPGDAHKKSPDTETGKSLRLKPIVQSILNKKVRNPETGKDIQIRSALQYDKKSPVFQAAKTMLKKKM